MHSLGRCCHTTVTRSPQGHLPAEGFRAAHVGSMQGLRRRACCLLSSSASRSVLGVSAAPARYSSQPQVQQQPAASSNFESGWQPPPFPPIGFISFDEAAEMANKIHLTGNLGTDFSSVDTSAGMVGKLVLYVKPKPRDRDYSERYTIELYSGLAEEARSKTRKGMRVHVEGRLRVDRPFVEKASGVQRLNLVVEAERLSILDDSAESQQQQQQQQHWEPPAAPAAAGDYPTHPPASSNTTVVSPPQVPSSSRAAPPAQQKGRAAPAAGGSAAPRTPFAKITPERERQLWEELEHNRAAFWDNRTNKFNPKAPDFKHKETGEALWLSSASAPEWAQTM